MIEHRKRSQLAQFNTHHIFNQAIHSLPFVPKKTNNTKKRRTGANVSTSNGNLTADPTSMKNHRTHSLVGIHDLSKHDGFSDPLSRRKRSSGSSQNLPSLPPPRTSMSHSRSLTTVNQTNLNLSSHKICTAVWNDTCLWFSFSITLISHSSFSLSSVCVLFSLSYLLYMYVLMCASMYIDEDRLWSARYFSEWMNWFSQVTTNLLWVFVT